MIRDLANRVLGPPLALRFAKRQRRLVMRALAAPDTLARFASKSALPSGYGIGANERVIEIPWLLSQRPRGRTLDAGSSLNHREFLDEVEPMVDELHIVTLAYEGKAYLKRGISYTFADLRELPYRDDTFDTVVSISTLEHVGMDNRGYAADERAAAPSEDPVVETSEAVHELARVTRHGGRLLVTVPYGEPENHGWQRQFDRTDVERLLETVGPEESDITVYRYSPQGWSASSLEGAQDARYRMPIGAEAVACIAMTR